MTYQGHNKRNIYNVLYDKTLISKVFNNELALYLQKKAERIVSAIYLLSEFISEKEPLKWNLRQEANNILKDMLDINISSNKTKKVKDLNTRLFKVSVLLDLSSNSGLLSQMNVKVLQNAILDFSKEISENKDPIKNEENNINKGHFELDKPQRQVVSYKREAEGIKDIKDIEKDTLDKGHKRQTNVIYKGLPNAGKSSDVLKAIQSSKSDRRSQIIDLIKDKKEVSIKDISLVITDCSEKTIQREINALVFENIVKKKGDRRWSRYSINEG